MHIEVLVLFSAENYVFYVQSERESVLKTNECWGIIQFSIVNLSDNSVQSVNHVVNTVNIPYALEYVASDGMDAKCSVISFGCLTSVAFVASILFHKTPDKINS
jgi:hypothetical protein